MREILYRHGNNEWKCEYFYFFSLKTFMPAYKTLHVYWIILQIWCDICSIANPYQDYMLKIMMRKTIYSTYAFGFTAWISLDTLFNDFYRFGTKQRETFGQHEHDKQVHRFDISNTNF